MSRLSYLNAQLNSLIEQQRLYELQLSTQKFRKSDLQKIIDNLVDECDDSHSRVNAFLPKINEDLRAGIKHSHIELVISAVSGDKEGSSYSDEKVVSALNDLRAEMRKVDSKISELNSNISSIKVRISNTRAAISEERRRLAEERRRLAEERRRRAESKA